MIPFICLIFIPLMIQHIKIRGFNYEKKNRFALNIFFCILTALLMCRGLDVGNDTRVYTRIFDSISGVPLADIDQFEGEFGFVILMKLISEITSNSQMYIAIMSLIIVILIVPTYKRLNVDTGLTISIFCALSTFVMMFSGIRQMTAIGLGFVAYHFVREKKIAPFLITVILAVTIHTSAIMLFFMYPVYHAKITKKWLAVIIPAMGICFIFNKQIFLFFSVFMEAYTRFDASIDSNGAYMMIFMLALLAAFSYIIPEEKTIDHEIIGLRNFLLLALLIQLFAPIHLLAMRMNYYYIIFIPLLIPKVISNRSESWKQVAVISRHMMVVLFLVYFFYTAVTVKPLHVFPYQFFWESM